MQGASGLLMHAESRLHVQVNWCLYEWLIIMLLLLFQWGSLPSNGVVPRETTTSWSWSSWVQVWRTCSTSAVADSVSKLSSSSQTNWFVEFLASLVHVGLCLPDWFVSSLLADQPNRIHPLKELHPQGREARQLSHGIRQKGKLGVYHRLWPGQEIQRRQNTPAHTVPRKQESHGNCQIRQHKHSLRNWLVSSSICSKEATAVICVWSHFWGPAIEQQIATAFSQRLSCSCHHGKPPQSLAFW